MKFIRVYEPFVARNQVAYVNDALSKNELTFHGEYIKRFESSLLQTTSKRHAVAVTNGSLALNAMYQVLDFRNSVVITSTMTYAATAAQLVLVGAKIVLVDCDRHLQLDASLLKHTLMYRPDYLVVPPMFGRTPDYPAICEFARKHRIGLLEDAAESFACTESGRHGLMSSYSFFANKIITCGEGGAITTDSDDLAWKLRKFINQGVCGRFDHNMVGTNFRMTNLQAAIGCAQLEELDEVIAKKALVYQIYDESLDSRLLRLTPYSNQDNYWMPVFQLPDGLTYDRFAQYLMSRGIDSRPVFKPIHQMATFEYHLEGVISNGQAEKLRSQCVVLPCGPNLSREDQSYIVQNVNDYLSKTITL